VARIGNGLISTTVPGESLGWQKAPVFGMMNLYKTDIMRSNQVL
jgi:hypothetical protein